MTQQTITRYTIGGTQRNNKCFNLCKMMMALWQGYNSRDWILHVSEYIIIITV